MKICGLDECGRGAFAGPLVAAAVVIHTDFETFPGFLPAPLRDSKKLTKIQREKIYQIRDSLPISFWIEEISVKDINERGIGWANNKVFEKLVKKIKATLYIVDGNIKFSDSRIKSLIKADGKCYPVMLASIIAKVYRDNLLSDLHKMHPFYDWDKNSGYGTKSHLAAIKTMGACKHHRTRYIETYLSHLHN